MKWVMVFLIMIFIPVVALAQPEIYHLKLLAVQEMSPGNFTGSDADLFLELKPGSGRVFLDTFPLTKLDTQISTRFAKDMACNHFKLDCSRHDFIFTIKAKSSIIGGPSAGAAISALTAIAMLDLKYDKGTTITATVNSGGVIGPVGGVKEKLEAAAKAGLKRVMIAEGSSAGHNDGNMTNQTFDLVKFGVENLSMEVIEVVDLDQVVFYLTGKNLNNKEYEVHENAEYSKIMQGLQELLCDRSDKLKEELQQEDVILDVNLTKIIDEKSESALNATNKGDYYSAASFCFGNNIDLKREFYLQKEINAAGYARLFHVLDRKVQLLEKEVESEKIETISDLQTYMVVKERLNDVKRQILKFNSSESPEVLAYAEERYYSALSWKQFFSMTGKKFNFDLDNLRNSCVGKISEAEERHQYAGLFLPHFTLTGIGEKISHARIANEQGEYPLCLITAAQAKADANAILSSLGLVEENLDKYVETKKKAAERVLAENIGDDVFPILGYSYYRYADSLNEVGKYNSLLYLEYALEMSDLGMYFPEKQKFLEFHAFKLENWHYVIIGFFLGLGVMWVYKRENSRWKKI